MAGIATKAPPITIEQYQAFEGYPGLRDELIHGRIVMSPRTKILHQVIASNIEHLLEACLQETTYRVVRDSNAQFPSSNSMPAPDVFVLTESELERVCERDEYLSVPPVLAIEILSPSNRKSKIAEKVEVYLSGGVPSVWVVSPKRRTVTVHTQSTLSLYD